MTTALLRRSVPFVGPDRTLVVDNVALGDAAWEGAVVQRLAGTLSLDGISEVFPEEIAVELVADQYEAALDYAFSHPLWDGFRDGTERSALLAYLVESRHYLHAAANRMAPGVASDFHDGPTVAVLAEHVVEEADHARFYDDALEMIGCPWRVAAAARPLPATLEWIHLMRTLEARGPLVAGLASGLMEASAANREVVRDWHEMLPAVGLLPGEAAAAIFQHMKLDMELGHGDNWREVLEHEAPLTARQLRDGLNAISTVGEMLYRWFEALHRGTAGLAIDVMRASDGLVAPQDPVIDAIFRGAPVWPSRILHDVSHGSADGDAVALVVASAYHLHGQVELPDGEGALAESRRFAERVSAPAAAGRDLEDVVDGWMRTIDGHRLWTEMTDAPTHALVHGWLLENHHYLASARRHVCAGIAACPDPVIRGLLLKHLEEEADHAQLLMQGLQASGAPLDPALCRPLPTTVAFAGYLREMASLDWRAYCVALAYLQFSFRPGDEHHPRFYAAVRERCPAAAGLVGAMQRHDEIDQGLGHDGDAHELLRVLSQRHDVTTESLERAAVLAQLAWSFLDGIRTHYGQGMHALVQRMGWSVRGSAMT